MAPPLPAFTSFWQGATWLGGREAPPRTTPSLWMTVGGRGEETYLSLMCWGAPRHLKLPSTMMASLVHKASHSSMLQGGGSMSAKQRDTGSQVTGHLVPTGQLAPGQHHREHLSVVDASPTTTKHLRFQPRKRGEI